MHPEISATECRAHRLHFPFLKNDVDYSKGASLFNAISSNTAYANKNLKIIAQKAGIEKHISFHTSRHTFATRAFAKGYVY